MTYWQLRILASLFCDGIDQQVYKTHIHNADLTALLTDIDAYRVECMRDVISLGRACEPDLAQKERHTCLIAATIEWQVIFYKQHQLDYVNLEGRKTWLIYNADRQYEAQGCTSSRVKCYARFATWSALIVLQISPRH